MHIPEAAESDIHEVDSAEEYPIRTPVDVCPDFFSENKIFWIIF
jgi:hypothetical protein